MGSYKEVKGDLLQMAKDGKFSVIAHGCNCYQSMGAGIALQIRKHFPENYQKDQDDPRLPLQRLGDYTKIEYSDLSVVNLYTQYSSGKDLSYTALKLSLHKLNMLYPGERVGLPQIGCGIAGGSWRKVKKIIKSTLTDCDVTVVIYKP